MAARPDRLHRHGVVGKAPEFYVQLGRRIAAFRRGLGLSQERLGERARVGSSYIAHIEIGSRKPTIDVLLRIAGAVDVPLWRLLTDDRFAPDERAWDAASRQLGEDVRGLPQQDLQALSYFAVRLKRGATVPARVTAPIALAAEPGTRTWRRRSKRTRP
jgi:transcriptional regulator with XRE-family HTH domain